MTHILQCRVVGFLARVIGYLRSTPVRRRYYHRWQLRVMGIGSIGTNVRIEKTAKLINIKNLHIGNNVIIDQFVTIVSGRNGVRIGSNIHIATGCLIAGGGGVEVGDFANLSSDVKIYSISDDYTGKAMTNPTVPERFKNTLYAKVIIGRHVIVGTASVVLPGVNLAEGTAIGAMSLATSSTEAWSIYAGQPCRKLRERERMPLDLERDYLGSIGTVFPTGSGQHAQAQSGQGGMPR